MNTVAGAIAVLGGISDFISEIVKQQGLPHDLLHWAIFVGLVSGGIGNIVSKQWNVTNSPQPAAPTVVPPVAMATPNPAAKIGV